MQAFLKALMILGGVVLIEAIRQTMPKQEAIPVKVIDQDNAPVPVPVNVLSEPIDWVQKAYYSTPSEN